MSDVHKQDIIRAFDDLLKSCVLIESMSTDDDLSMSLAFGCGVYTAACAIMGEDEAKKLADLHFKESLIPLKPKLRIVK